MKMVIYLHGFLSSPKSVKAQHTLHYLQTHHPDVKVICPELSNHPGELHNQLTQLLTTHLEWQESGLKVIGSSMGGYLASYLVEQYGGKAVLINPAVKPYDLLEGYLGEHVNPYTGKGFRLDATDIEYVKYLDTPTIHDPENYHLMLQTLDETLDFRQAVTKYQGASMLIEQGGDHSFIGYENHLPDIMSFLGINRYAA